jgi:hypothetical protein
MKNVTFAIAVVVLAFAVSSSASAQAAPPLPAGAALTAIVDQALMLLGQPKQSVVIFDPLQYDSDHRAKLEHYEAFVLAKQPAIYLNRRGWAVEEALSGRPDGVYIVAAILAHERAHLEGKDESGALAAEERCVYQFMKEGRIPVDVALRHLQSAWRLRR